MHSYLSFPSQLGEVSTQDGIITGHESIIPARTRLAEVTVARTPSNALKAAPKPARELLPPVGSIVVYWMPTHLPPISPLIQSVLRSRAAPTSARGDYFRLTKNQQHRDCFAFTRATHVTL
jgi:hypothetical protein